MRSNAAVTVLALSLLLMAACGKREPLPNQPVRERGAAPTLPVAPQPQPEQSPSQLPTRAEVPLAQLTASDQPPDTTVTTTAEEAAPDAPDKPRRNLQGELESMMGSPVDCLEARPASAAVSTIPINLSANVMPSGAVGRGEISAPGLRPAEVSCLRARLESLRFAQPIENAPIAIHGSLTLTPQVAPAPAAPAADGGMKQ